MTDLSAQTLRDVEFREKIRGYHPDDVDAILERVAIGVDALTQRLRQAEERAQRTEQQLSEAVTDETLRRTLVLAQRTADLAVAEAKESADRLLYDARREAEAML